MSCFPRLSLALAMMVGAQSLHATPQGAAKPGHWSLAPIRNPELPAVRDAAWPRNDIDRFVLARIEAAQRRPSPVADRETLLRRVTLDLTGLPPTPQEVRAFCDDDSPQAYQHVVDRLLASPRYGEHMAHYWLDAARYGDTHGLHLDNYREIWPYRDWVVRALNANMPFDHFGTEQLAGDMLPNATRDQQIASAFVRAHVSTNEGGSIEEEVYVRNVVDRVNTFGTVFLGMTIACAQCHDHKFDPLTQRDYYGLFAFLNNEDGRPMDDNIKDPAPNLRVPSAEQESQSTQLRAEREAVEKRIADAVAVYDYVEPPAVAAQPRRETIWFDDDDPAGSRPQGSAPEWVDAPRFCGARAMRRTGEGLHQHFFTDAPSMLRVGVDDEFFVHVWLDPSNPPREVMLQLNDQGGSWDHRAIWGEDVIAWGEAGKASRRAMGALPPTGRWVRLAVRASEVGLPAGSFVNGMAFTQHGGSVVWDAAGIASSVPQQREDFVWIDDELPPGAKPEGDGAIWNWSAAGDGFTPYSGSRALRRHMGKGLNQDFFTGAEPPLVLQRGDVLFAQVWLDPVDPPRSIQLQFNDGSWNHRVRFGDAAHGAGMGGGADFRAGDLPETGRWVRLEVALADVGLAPGAKLNGFAFTQVGGSVAWDAAGVSGYAQRSDRARESMQAWLQAAVADESLPDAVKAALKVDAGARSAEQQALLRSHYLRRVNAKARLALAPLEAELAAVGKRAEAVDAAVPSMIVMRERGEMRPSFVLRRGEYDKRGAEVTRAVPACLPPMPKELPRNRLGLAQWLWRDENPLTARVTVNRFWQQFFGVGIVKTAEDFGVQGERPVDPALLDWLASDFRSHGWDVKRLVRQIVTSATYMQSSSATVADFRADPENRLLARGPRHRLDAEVLRDQALFIGGLLVERLGGPPVRPPQPEGLWEAVAYVGSNTMNFVADRGAEKVHRRSLYTFWKRTAAPPQMAVLDAPSREDCRVRRERTDTPLQALLLMNDPQFFEAARGLAQRVLVSGAADDAARLRYAVELATARSARPDDLAELGALLARERARFAEDRDAARAAISIGADAPDPSLDVAELAAWTIVGNLLLNLDEVLTKS
ncbi:MAG: DUF1549 and DUF1553 domain-containing protein [Planctomycetota bacterium]